jgi:triacylglycerol esterase/lipase EstA (alpha/beta hydrolase family)
MLLVKAQKSFVANLRRPLFRTHRKEEKTRPRGHPPVLPRTGKPASSVEDCGREISERIRQIAGESGCGKVNFIAHSKGGLDCRYAVTRFAAGEYVASLTTINTPHRGCQFADYLLSKVPENPRDFVAQKYNAARGRESGFPGCCP